MSQYNSVNLVGDYKSNQPLSVGCAVYLVAGKQEFTDYTNKSGNTFIGIALSDTNVVSDINMQGEVRSRITVAMSGQVMVCAGETLAVGDLLKIGAGGKIFKETGNAVSNSTIGVALENIAKDKYGSIHLASKDYAKES